MAFIGFGKKIEEDINDAEEEFIPSRESLKTKKNPGFEDKRKFKRKKEPSKPWGKKERLLVFWVLIVTVVSSAILGLSAREWKLPGLPRIKLPDFKIFNAETIIIEKTDEEADQLIRERGNYIIEKFKTEVGELSGIYGFYVVDLNTGYGFGLFEKEEFQAASLVKLPIMAGMYAKAEAGSLNLDDKYTLKDSDKTAGAGSLYSKPEGYQITYRNLINLMGKQSDNTAFTIGKHILGDEGITEIINKIGIPNTSISQNLTTPKDIGVFFEELWQGNIIDKKNQVELLDSITDTIYEQWLVAGVPEEIRVAHKFGRELHVVNDAGIVYSKRPYIAVIMTKGIIEREADNIFPSLSKIIYEGMTKDK